MKKFRSFKQPQQKEEKKSNIGVYWSIFIALLMIGSVGSIFMYNPDSSSQYVYGKYSFSSKNGLWASKIDKKEYTFYFLPDQLSQLNLSYEVSNALTSRNGLIILFNPSINDSNKLQAIDIFRYDMVDTYMSAKPNNQLGIAVTLNNSIYNYPVASCNNASYAYPILELKYSNQTAISYSNNCIIALASDEKSMLMILDRLRFVLLGVSNE